ncbi:MAG: signal peptidase II [Fibrobacterota bacterium]|nr:signal peptidase II [Fibrobacterota bacterium]
MTTPQPSQEDIAENLSITARWRAHLGLGVLFLITLVIDQYTKHLARVNFGFPDGEPDYFKIKQVFGEWLQFRLIYNSGAAFGMKPQELLPFLNPTLFYVLFSTVAVGFLIFLYRKLPRDDYWQKSGIVLILSGAAGNLIDRVRFHKVTDFIDVGIPAISTRWPTFNIADSCVCVGVAMILLSSWIPRRREPEAAPGKSTQSIEGEASIGSGTAGATPDQN